MGPASVEAARRVARGGRAAICRQNLSSRGRGTAGLCLGAASLHSGTYAASGPEPGTWKDPDPRRRSSRGIRGLSIGLAARHWRGNVTPAGCPVSTTSWRYGLRRTCRLVTGRSYRPRSTWSNQARLALLAVTHRYKRAHCLWLEQFQIAEYGRVAGWSVVLGPPDLPLMRVWRGGLHRPHMAWATLVVPGSRCRTGHGITYLPGTFGASATARRIRSGSGPVRPPRADLVGETAG